MLYRMRADHEVGDDVLPDLEWRATFLAADRPSGAALGTDERRRSLPRVDPPRAARAMQGYAARRPKADAGVLDEAFEVIRLFEVSG